MERMEFCRQYCRAAMELGDATGNLHLKFCKVLTALVLFIIRPHIIIIMTIINIDACSHMYAINFVKSQI